MDIMLHLMARQMGININSGNANNGRGAMIIMEAKATTVVL